LSDTDALIHHTPYTIQYTTHSVGCRRPHTSYTHTPYIIHPHTIQHTPTHDTIYTRYCQIQMPSYTIHHTPYNTQQTVSDVDAPTQHTPTLNTTYTHTPYDIHQIWLDTDALIHHTPCNTYNTQQTVSDVDALIAAHNRYSASPAYDLKRQHFLSLQLAHSVYRMRIFFLVSYVCIGMCLLCWS